MHDRDRPGSVPDYTDAFLATLGVLLFVLLLSVSAVMGWTGVIALVVLTDRTIVLVGRHAD